MLTGYSPLLLYTVALGFLATVSLLSVEEPWNSLRNGGPSEKGFNSSRRRASINLE